MLIVTGVIEVAPENVVQAMAAARAMVAETLREEGCRVYEFSRILGAENRFRIYEEWESEAALNAHFQTPHMARFRAELGRIGILSREIAKIEAGARTPLG